MLQIVASLTIVIDDASLGSITIVSTFIVRQNLFIIQATGNTKGGSVTVPLTSRLTGLKKSVLKIKTKIVSCHTADSKPVKQEINGTVILPPLVFLGKTTLKSSEAKILSLSPNSQHFIFFIY